jgi:hypothetical protein
MLVYIIQNYCVSGLCPPSGILNTRKHNVSEIGSVSGMASSGMLRRVAVERTDVSEELGASFIRVTKIGYVTMRNVPEYAILHSHRRENLKSYMNLFPLSDYAKHLLSWVP